MLGALQGERPKARAHAAAAAAARAAAEATAEATATTAAGELRGAACDGVSAHQIRLHELKNQVDITVVVRLEHIRQRDDVLVPLHLLQEHDLAKGPLRVGSVLEGVEDLLQRDNLLCPLVHRPPHDAVGALTELLHDIILSQHVPIDLFTHFARGARTERR